MVLLYKFIIYIYYKYKLQTYTCTRTHIIAIVKLIRYINDIFFRKQGYVTDRSKKKMRQRRSDNDCYCKKQETINESQYFYPSTTSLMDHSPVHSSQSQRNSEEVEPSREKLIDRRSTTIDFDIESV